MTNKEMQSWLVDILQNQKEQVVSVDMDGELDQILVKTPSGQEYAIRVHDAAYTAKTHALEHYAALSLSTAVTGLFELGFISQKAAADYLESLAKYV